MTRRSTLITVVVAGCLALVVAVVAWAAVATPWGSAVVRDVASGVAPPSPAVLQGDETYLASELEALVVGGSVLGPATGDGELGIERVTSGENRISPSVCADLTGVGTIYPSGYRSRTGESFRSEVLMFPSVVDAADEYGDLLSASGRCGRIEERTDDFELLGTSVYLEAATGTVDTSGGATGAVHWFAGLRTDQTGAMTALVAATTGNVVQSFLYGPVPSIAAGEAEALSRSVAERLAESGLRSLQTRRNGAFAAGYSSGTPVPPDPAPRTRFAGALRGLSEAPAAPLSPDFFTSAPVPWLCDFEGGTLVDGVLPGFAERSGGVYLSEIGPGEGAHSALDPAPTGSSAAGAAVIGCNHGGVSWPDSLVFYSASGEVLGSIGVTDIVPGGYRDWVTEVSFDVDAYRLAWQWEDQGGGSVPRPVTATIRWDGVRLVVSDVTIGERPS